MGQILTLELSTHFFFRRAELLWQSCVRYSGDQVKLSIYVLIEIYLYLHCTWNEKRELYSPTHNILSRTPLLIWAYLHHVIHHSCCLSLPQRPLCCFWLLPSKRGSPCSGAGGVRRHGQRAPTKAILRCRNAHEESKMLWERWRGTPNPKQKMHSTRQCLKLAALAKQNVVIA